MKKLISAIKRAPKSAASFAIIAAAVVVPAALFAWGPDRPTYSFDNPAPHVTFNSMPENPTHGDERNFVQIKDATAGGNFTEEVNFVPGHEYEVYAYYHNNASTTLNESGEGIAQNTQMRFVLPAQVQDGQKVDVAGVISADNAQPKEVWDEARGTATEGDVVLRYVQDSATVHSNGAVNGQKLPNSLFTTGAHLGYDALDGKVPGCNEFAGYVTFRFKVGQPNFEVTKTVSEKGKNTFQESVTTTAGAEVEYKIQYKNTGSTQQNDVVLKDSLPNGVSYVAGSTKLATSVSNGQYVGVADGITTDTGINVGAYAPNGNAIVKFTAKVDANDELEKCGENTLINKATAETNNGSKHDTANVVVTKDCEEPEEKTIEVCVLDTKAVATIKESEFDDSKHSKNLDDCKEVPVEENIEVCVLDTKAIATIKESEFDDSKHSMNLDDCEEVPVTPEEPKNPETPKTPETPKNPEVPTELPETGTGNNVLSLFGLDALVAATGYYVASRRNIIGE